MTRLDTSDALLRWIADGRSLRGTVLFDLDLRGLGPLLRSLRGDGALFLGCHLEPDVAAHLVSTGALLFPALPGLPFEPYRPRLYAPAELMDGYVRGHPATYAETVDARIYAWYLGFRSEPGAGDILETLAMRLHDHAIDDALYTLVDGASPRRLVGIMGGHAIGRDEPSYREVARLGALLAREGFLVATGGGPGAMEAAHLGARLADHPLDAALDALAKVPSWREPGWFDSALDVRDAYPSARESLAIPTWTYGHEPTNLFASHVAKYFSNAIREDVLVSVAKHGIVFTSGSAGTVQEIFADATQNHYGTETVLSPMVFLGRENWEERVPVIPLLEKLAGYRRYRDLIAVVDTADEAVAFIRSHPPVPAEAAATGAAPPRPPDTGPRKS